MRFLFFNVLFFIKIYKKIKIFVDISESKVYDNKASCRYDNLSRSLRNKQK